MFGSWNCRHRRHRGRHRGRHRRRCENVNRSDSKPLADLFIYLVSAFLVGM